MANKQKLVLAPPPEAVPLIQTHEDPTDFSFMGTGAAPGAPQDDPTDFSFMTGPQGGTIPEPITAPPTLSGQGMPPIPAPAPPPVAVTTPIQQPQAPPVVPPKQGAQGVSGLAPLTTQPVPKTPQETLNEQLAVADKTMVGNMQNTAEQLPVVGPFIHDVMNPAYDDATKWRAFGTGAAIGVPKSIEDVVNFFQASPAVMAQRQMEALWRGARLALREGDYLGAAESAKEFLTMRPNTTNYAGMLEESQPVKPLKDAMPALFGTGEMVGGNAIPMAIPMGGALKGAPVIRALLEGALTGGAMGTIGAGGEQIRQTGELDQGKAMLEGGVPGALLGGGLGAGGAALAKGLGKIFKSAPDSATPPVSPPDAPPPAAPKNPALDYKPEPKTPDGEAVDLNKRLKVDAQLIPKKEAGLDAVAEALPDTARIDEMRDKFGIKKAGVEPEAPPTPPPAQQEPPVIEAPAAPAVEAPPEQKGFFGNTRTYKQGMSGDDVRVTFPTPLERDLVSYATKPQNFTPEQANALADKLGVPHEEFLAYARGYADKVKQLAKEGRVENPEMTAPVAEPYQVPLKSPESMPPAPASSEGLQLAQEAPVIEPEAAPAASPQEAPPVVPEQAAKIESTPEIAKMEPPRPENTVHTAANGKYHVIKEGDRYKVIETATGAGAELKGTKNKKDAIRAADNFDNGTSVWGQGRKKGGLQPLTKKPQAAPGSKEFVSERIASGQKIDDLNIADDDKALLNQVAEQKRQLESMNAALNGAQRQFFAKAGKMPGSKKLSAEQEAQLQELERKLLAEAGLTRKELNDTPTVEVMGANKPKAVAPAEFELAGTRAEQIDQIKTMIGARDAAAKELDALRGRVKQRMDEGGIPESVTMGDGDLAVNVSKQIRKNYGKLPDAIQKVKDAERARLLEGNPDKPDVTKTFFNNFAKELEKRSPEQIAKKLDDYDNADTEIDIMEGLLAKDKKRTLGDFVKDVLKPDGKAMAAVDPITPFVMGVARVAKNAAKTPEAKRAAAELAQLASDNRHLNPLRLLRRSSDVLQEADGATYKKFVDNISKEAILGRGLEFKPEQYDLLDKSLSMTDDAILKGENGLNALSQQAREFLVLRRDLRRETADALGELITKMTEYHEQSGHRWVGDDVDILKSMEQSLRATGKNDKIETTGKTLMAMLGQAFNDYTFRWNPAFHALNRTDPWIAGSSRIGITRVAAATHLLSTDKAVKEFADSFQFKGVFEEARNEVTRAARGNINVVDAAYGAVEGGLNKLTANRPALKKLTSVTKNDLPSERWNNNDMFVGGLIQYGDKQLGKGKGAQYVKDLAAGKLSPEETVEAIGHAIGVTNDVTGAGMFGLDRDLLGRNGTARIMFQFLSQPFRVARLMTKYGEEMPKNPGESIRKTATLLGMTAAIGGRAAIPKDVATIWGGIHPESLEFVEDQLDNWGNVPSKVPVVGRDLADKLSYSVMPFLGFRTNAMIETAGKMLEGVERGKAEQIQRGMILMAVPTMFGVGTGTWMRAQREMNALNAEVPDEPGKKGYKATSIYSSAIGEMQSRSVGKVHQKGFTPLNAAKNIFLPGDEPEVGAAKREFRQEARIKDVRK